jgi:hypothetical protein
VEGKTAGGDIAIDVDLAGHISRVLLPLYPSGQEFGGLRVKVETDAHLVYQWFVLLDRPFGLSEHKVYFIISGNRASTEP